MDAPPPSTTDRREGPAGLMFRVVITLIRSGVMSSFW